MNPAEPGEPEDRGLSRNEVLLYPCKFVFRTSIVAMGAVNSAVRKEKTLMFK